jgi:myo-inositol 2-dehydrogenase/D-chiro-inositol 1-dehydrogenase
MPAEPLLQDRPMTLSLALIGAGRIGRTHAAALAAVPGTRLAAVSDPLAEAAAAIATPAGARVDSVAGILADPGIDAVMICSPTDLHADQIEAAARAGKAIFCEKPIDLSLPRAEACLAVVRDTGARLMLGFNRRFDPNFAAMAARLRAGEIGALELIQITSRDPAPPPVAYIARSGGLFRDMTIHDFDMARFLMAEEFTAVAAAGSVLVDPAIGTAGDIDTAVVTLRTASGRLAVITNSRRATYGYDQRAEAHGQKGMLRVDNPAPHTVVSGNAAGYRGAPLMDFFMDRYAAAYRAEIAAFATALRDGTPLSPTGEDGLAALRLADAATRALASGRWETVG